MPQWEGSVERTQGEAMAAHRHAVWRFVLRQVRDEALAEDLTQETFVRVERSSSTHRGESSERSWLCAIALNVVRDHFRTAGRIPDSSSVAEVLDGAKSAEDGEHALLESEMAACIGEFLVQLPHPQHDVVALHDMAGLTHREIASVLGISLANSRVVLHRGRAALREILRRNCVLCFDGESVPCERKPPSERKG